MKLGIDFGTSYSAAAILMGAEVKSIKFNDEEQFRTAAYFPEKIPSLSDYKVTPELQQKADTTLPQGSSKCGNASFCCVARP